MAVKQKIQLEIDLTLLKRLLKARMLAVSDIQCANTTDKHTLHRTLLQVVAEDARVN